MEDKNKKPTPPAWAHVAKLKMQQLGLIQEDLVDVFDVKTRGAVGHYFSGRRKISSDQLIALADKLKLSADNLYNNELGDNGRFRSRGFLYGDGNQPNKTAASEQELGDFLHYKVMDRGGPRKVPVISWVQAGVWAQVVDSHEPGDAFEWMWCPEGNPSENTFGLKVKGDSMTAQSPADRNYPEGCIIFVDPNKRVENGSRVVAKIPGQESATFKIYKEDMGRKKLVPINTRVYDVLDITDMDVTICGVVIGSYMPE